MSESIIRCRNLSKSYHDGVAAVHVLQGVDFSITAGDCVAIVGPSGSGKSTFLHLLGGLDRPTDGQVMIHDSDWQQLSEKQRCQVRNRSLGFVYQFHHLLPEFSALENVAMPLLVSGLSVQEARDRARTLLAQVGLAARERHKPSQLSGGERQRVAIARALVHRPQCVFADEPTGNLDQATAQQIFELMLMLNRELGTALVIVTHDRQLARCMGRTVALQQGRLAERISPDT